MQRNTNASKLYKISTQSTCTFATNVENVWSVILLIYFGTKFMKHNQIMNIVFKLLSQSGLAK